MRTLFTALVIAVSVALLLAQCEQRPKDKSRKAAIAAACQVIVEAGLVKSCEVR